MTIVMIGQKGLPARSGGIERHVSLLASGLVSAGHRVIVYGRKWYVGSAEAPAGVEQQLSPGIHTKHLDAITHSFTALLAARKERPDIVHLHGSGIALLVPVARLLHPQAKVVVTFHCLDHRLSKWNTLARLAFRIGEWLACHVAHRTITVSETLTRYCLERYGCQVTYIPHPFTLPHNTPSPEGLASFDLQVSNYLLFVGRLIPDKQAHVLIQGYQLACARDPKWFSDLPLVIVGGGSWTKDYVRWLYQMSATTPGVKLLGERFGKELQTLQAHAFAHVFPTASEGLSMAMLEAAAYERPMVVSAIPENREATGGYAIEIFQSDPEAVCDSLVKLMNLSEEERNKMGKQLRVHVEKSFHAETRIQDVVRLYEELRTDSFSVNPAPIKIV